MGAWLDRVLVVLAAGAVAILAGADGVSAAVSPLSPGGFPMSGAGPSPSMVEEAGASEVREADRQAWLGGAEARSERAASRSAFGDLGADGAMALAHREFGRLVEGPLWSAPALDPGERSAGVRGDRVMVLERAGRPAGLVDSTVPLVSEVGDGSRAPTDLSLRATGRSFAPVNPVAALRIPRRLGDGIALPGAGVSLTGVAGAPSVEGTLAEDRVFFADAARDSDLIVGAAPGGVQVDYQLRSPQSPGSFDLGLSLPAGAELQMSDVQPGAAEVVRGGEVVATVSPPSAADAQGQPVAARYALAEGRLTLEVDHAQADVAYPVLVDPVLDDQVSWQANPGIGIGGWAFDSPNPNFWFGTSGNYGRGLYLGVGGNNPYTHTWWSRWAYRAPAQSHVYRADYIGLTHTPTGLPVCYSLGFQNGTTWDTSTYYGQGPWGGNNGTGPFASCGGIVNYQVAHCLNPYCSESTGHAGNMASMQQWIYGDGNRPNGNQTYLAGARVYLGDSEAPAIAGGPPADTNAPPTGTFTFTHQDPGLGVHQVVISSPTKPDWNRNYTTTYSCYGTAWSPCPSTLQSAVVEYGNLPEGQNTVRVTVTDAGNKTTVKDWPVRIDRTAPAIELDGEVIDADPVTVGDDEFPVFFSATDAVAGVGRVDLLLDNQTAALDSQSQGCPGGGCPFEGSLALDTASIPEGTHTIRVRVWDGFGNWRDSASQAIIVDKTPPTLSLSGALAAADGTTVTAPTYGLTASATDPASGGVAAGVTQTTFNVAAASDGASQECPAGGCSQTSQFTYQTGHYGTGTHQVTVTAEDAAGNATDRTVTVSDQAAATTCAPSGVDGFGNACDPPPAWCTATSEPLAPAGSPAVRLTAQQARDSIAAARPGVVAASTTTTGSGVDIRPTVDPASGGYEGESMLSAADLPAAPEGGRIVGPPGQQSCLRPVGVAADATAGLKSGDTVVYANVKEGVDLAARATPEGLDQLLQIRTAASPRSFSWRVALQAGERLEQLSDQSVAIVADSPANQGTASQPPEADLEGSAVTPSSVADSALQLQTSRIQSDAASQKVEGDVKAVISAPPGQDAAQAPVATTLTASGDTVTVQAAQPGAYPATVLAAASASVPIKVMTWNIMTLANRGPGKPYPAFTQSVANSFADTVAHEAPDVLVLQESCWKQSALKIKNALDGLGLSMKPAAVGDARVGRTGCDVFGNRILVRSGATVRDSQTDWCLVIPCPNPRRTERRNMTAATITLKGVTLRVYALHLAAGTAPGGAAYTAWVNRWQPRYRRLANIIDISTASKKAVAGDLNAGHIPGASQDFLRPLVEPFVFELEAGDPPSADPLPYNDVDVLRRWTTKIPVAGQIKNVKFDYVLAPKEWTVTARVPDVAYSDHRPVGATLHVPG